ncbi:hypothetical protein CEXT_456731 [Caerostris extrusa]|uniref:Uncharacterized protein n=1 Tax=Caerostris extrusa TaxID=172846 RepID=A0AAV4UKR4_CAEEX|nr:hypothetical protein CEXT_456731 [Caerostris extrusa]
MVEDECWFHWIVCKQKLTSPSASTLRFLQIRLDVVLYEYFKHASCFKGIFLKFQAEQKQRFLCPKVSISSCISSFHSEVSSSPSLPPPPVIRSGVKLRHLLPTPTKSTHLLSRHLRADIPLHLLFGTD